MNKVKLIKLLFMPVLFLSCATHIQKELNASEMVEWFQKDKINFLHEKNVGSYAFKLQFVPAEIKILSEVDNPSQISETYYNKRIKEVQDNIFCYFEIIPLDNTRTMLETEADNPTDYGERLNYFVSYAQKDIYLVQGKDTLKCLNYHFENTYGVKKSNTMALLFQKKDSKEDIEFVFDDKVLNTGPIKFTQNSFTTIPTPAIKFN